MQPWPLSLAGSHAAVSPALSRASALLSVMEFFLCFNKCVFANVSLGENIFLLFLCVTSLGLSGEVKPTALALAPFLACPLLFFFSLSFWRGNKSLFLVPSLAPIPLTCWVFSSVALETAVMTHSPT